MSIDHEAGTCFVRYVSYGNEEEQELKDLLKSAPKPKIVQKESDAEVKSFYPEILQLLASKNLLLLLSRKNRTLRLIFLS